MTPQAKKIFDYMMLGNRIDRKIAMAVFDVQNLTARISELRKEGVSFITLGRGGHAATYVMNDYDKYINKQFKTYNAYNARIQF